MVDQPSEEEIKKAIGFQAGDVGSALGLAALFNNGTWRLRYPLDRVIYNDEGMTFFSSINPNAKFFFHHDGKQWRNQGMQLEKEPDGYYIRCCECNKEGKFDNEALAKFWAAGHIEHTGHADIELGPFF